MGIKTTFEKNGFERYEEDVLNRFVICDAEVDEDGNFIAKHGGQTLFVPRDVVHKCYINYLNGNTDYPGAVLRMVSYATREVKKAFKLDV